MQYWGKLLGFILGYLSGTGAWGLFLGLFLGHVYDVSRTSWQRGSPSGRENRQSLFFQTTFQVMGHLSKSKGRVTEADIQVASHCMDQMQLQGESRQAAQRAFREGKSASYPLRSRLQQFRMECGGRADLIGMFLNIQLQLAFADGHIHEQERQLLYVIGEELGVSRTQLNQYIHMMEGGRQFREKRREQQHSGQRQTQAAPQGPTLRDACQVLGVSEQDDMTQIKRAYRRLMGEYHPDKLVAKGLPREMMDMAKRKAQDIQAAYDLIKKARRVS